MNNINIDSHPDVEAVFMRYPDPVKSKLLNLRRIIIEAASEMHDIETIEETLKWGEPSYLTAIGSTVRMDWKERTPDCYALYFKCTSKLIPGFKRIYPNTFNFEGNRALVFGLNDQLPVEELKKCIAAALRYHRVKHLPDLGMVSSEG